MGVNYKKLWKTLIDKEMSKSELRIKAQIAASTLSRMNKNEFVSLEVLVKICIVLKCEIGDIIEITQE